MPRRSPAPDTPTLFDTLVTTYRFLLVIDPAPAVMARVSEWKQVLRERIGSYSGQYSIPHITLFFADLPIECERDLTEGIQRGCIGMRPFKLQLNGISHFPDKRTIHVDPVEKEAIGALRDRIVDHVRVFKRIKKIGVKPTDQPHLTIAAGLETHQFDEAWAALAPHVFTSEQRVNDVVLMKRELLPDTVYEHLRTFPLEPAM